MGVFYPWMTIIWKKTITLFQSWHKTCQSWLAPYSSSETNHITKVTGICLDILYPRYCYVCKKSLTNSENLYLCWSCLRQIPLIRGPICRRCGMALGTMEAKSCLACHHQKFAFQETRCAGKYQATLRDLILSFKFHGAIHLQYLLAGMIAWQIRTHPFPVPPEAIVPVPMLPSDEYRRGYNQAEVIAIILAQRLKIPCYRHGLEKKKSNARQADLTRQERKKNVVDAFGVSPAYHILLQHKTVLLVDDIFTTGSTAHECARTLRKNQARHVYVATIARTVFN